MSSNRPGGNAPGRQSLADIALAGERLLWTVLTAGSPCEIELRRQLVALVCEAYDTGYQDMADRRLRARIDQTRG